MSSPRPRLMPVVDCESLVLWVDASDGLGEFQGCFEVHGVSDIGQANELAVGDRSCDLFGVLDPEDRVGRAANDGRWSGDVGEVVAVVAEEELDRPIVQCRVCVEIERCCDDAVNKVGVPIAEAGLE